MRSNGFKYCLQSCFVFRFPFPAASWPLLRKTNAALAGLSCPLLLRLLLPLLLPFVLTPPPPPPTANTIASRDRHPRIGAARWVRDHLGGGSGAGNNAGGDAVAGGGDAHAVALAKKDQKAKNQRLHGAPIVLDPIILEGEGALVGRSGAFLCRGGRRRRRRRRR